MSTPVTATKYPDYKNDTTSQTLGCDAICIFSAAAQVIIFILGVAGNGLVIWIAGFKVKKSVVTTWYLSLAVSDLVFCSFLPFEIIDAVKSYWLFGRFMCKFSYLIRWLNMYSSIFLLVIISVDRCVIVTFPVWAQNKRTIRKASVTVVLAWIIAAVLSIPLHAFRDVRHKASRQETVCVNMENLEIRITNVACRFVFLFVIPFMVIIICYVVIIRKLSNQKGVYKKPLKVITVLTVTFLICWLPFHTVIIIRLFRAYRQSLQTAYEFSFILAKANSCLNPFLYAFMGKDIKEQCYAFWLKIENAFKEEEDQENI